MKKLPYRGEIDTLYCDIDTKIKKSAPGNWEPVNNEALSGSGVIVITRCHWSISCHCISVYYYSISATLLGFKLVPQSAKKGVQSIMIWTTLELRTSMKYQTLRYLKCNYVMYLSKSRLERDGLDAIKNQPGSWVAFHVGIIHYFSKSPCQSCYLILGLADRQQ